jgi:hypothetical protein
MTIFLAILAAVFLGLFLAFLLKTRRLEKLVAKRDGEIAAVKQESERIQKHYESEAQRIYSEAQQAVANAQRLIDEQRKAVEQESERARQHYEAEARRIQAEANTALASAQQKMQSLHKYESLRDSEAEVRRGLAEAMSEAAALRKEAHALVEQARIAADGERSQAVQRVKALREQAEALLNQATRDAGRIMAEAEKRAEDIGGDAYRALREKEQLERAAEAMRNIVEGYGDRYLIPTHNLLDDLAAEFGYAAAGESLKSARDLSRRMVEQGEAATCDYAEANRRKIAINFVIFAFNGLVDSILSDIRKGDPGTLEQEIRDAFSLVNKDGKAFREARILPAYLDARLAELKWGAVVQEMERQRQEEQRYARQQARDEEKARREKERAIQEATREEELLRKAEEEARRTNEQAIAELNARLEKANEAQRAELQKAIAEQKAKFELQLQQKDEEIRLAEEKRQRAISNAQKTKHGHVYIISNIGSFNENVFKIGLTRRDDWQERIDELGDASVPFEFDVHGIIESDNAPELEYKLQQRFLAKRVNKQNSRKEFFRVSLKEIMQEVGKLKKGEEYIGDIQWTEEARAAQWKETRDIESSPEKLEKWLRAEQARNGRSPEFDAVTSFEDSTDKSRGLSRGI